MSDAPDTIQAIATELERLREQNDRLVNRVTSLEDELAQTTDRLEELEARNQTLCEENRVLEHRIDDLEDVTTRIDALTDATRKRTEATKARVEELQARELEKGAHLRDTTVDIHSIEVDGCHLEKIRKENGQTYYRLPESDDPLERGGTVALSHGDLLPIQQLAQMDEDMLRSTTSALPSQLAAKLWKARTDPNIGDNPWERGSKNVREYVKASDLKHWIRRQEQGVSETYAKKLVSRTIDALMDLSQNRLGIRKKTERKNGLPYKERRILLLDDADIPGEFTGTSTEPASQETAGVSG